MIRIWVIVLAALLCVAAAAPDPREADFAKSLPLKPGAQVQYFDEAGRQISFAAFSELLAKGRSFDFSHPNKSWGQARINSTKATTRTRPGYKVRAGDAFPAFKLKNVNGQVVSNADLVGHYTLINFFFADCGPCIAEVPSLNAFALKHPETRVLAVTFDSPRIARDFASQRGFQWPILAKGQSLISSVGVFAFPAFAMVGPDGRVLGIATSTAINSTKRVVDETSLSSWVAKKREGAQ